MKRDGTCISYFIDCNCSSVLVNTFLKAYVSFSAKTIKLTIKNIHIQMVVLEYYTYYKKRLHFKLVPWCVKERIRYFISYSMTQIKRGHYKKKWVELSSFSLQRRHQDRPKMRFLRRFYVVRSFWWAINQKKKSVFECIIMTKFCSIWDPRQFPGSFYCGEGYILL